MIELIGVASLAACLVAVSTLAARRWGHGVGGVVSAFPLIVGPALLLATVRHDAAFAASMATATLLGLLTVSGFVLAYGHSARHCGWPLSLAVAWAAAALLGMLAGRIGGGVPGAVAAATVSLAIAHVALPRRRNTDLRASLPQWELPTRMALTALLIVGLTIAGGRFGPTVAGVLAALPTLASVLAVFTHARHGHDALVAMLRGMLGGLASFVTFCASIALVIEAAGVIPAFLIATAAAVLVQLLAAWSHAATAESTPLAARSA